MAAPHTALAGRAARRHDLVRGDLGAAGALGAAAVWYWHDIHGGFLDLWRPKAWLRALGQAAALTHMRGGGEKCAYPDNEPSRARRLYHFAAAYGFGLCVVSTTSAAVMQNILGVYPPYPYLSVPVVTGTVGGLGMLVGVVGLVAVKRRADPALTTPATLSADYGLLWALLFLSVTGLLTLVLRGGILFGPVLVVHLAAVVVAFAIAPYTKFVHALFRLLAIYKDNLDVDRRARRTDPVPSAR